MDKVTKVTRRQKAFLKAYEELGTVEAAAHNIGVSKMTIYRDLNKSPGFQAALEEIKSHNIDLLEETAYRRALQGSDKLTEFMLKANAPEKYGDKSRLAVSFPVPLQIQMSDDSGDDKATQVPEQGDPGKQ